MIRAIFAAFFIMICALSLDAQEMITFEAGGTISKYQCICLSGSTWKASTDAQCQDSSFTLTYKCDAVALQDMAATDVGVAVVSGYAQVLTLSAVGRYDPIFMEPSSGFLTKSVSTTITEKLSTFVGVAMDATSGSADFVTVWIHPKMERYPSNDIETLHHTSVLTRYGESVRWLSTPDVAISNPAEPNTRSRIGWAAPETVSATTMQEIMMPGLTETGTASKDDDEHHFVSLASAATTNSFAGWQHTNWNSARVIWRPKLSGLVKLGSTIANSRIWFGLFESDPTTLALATSDTASGNQFIAIGYENGIAGGHWLCCEGDGTNYSCPASGDSGLTPAAGETWQLTVEYQELNNAVICTATKETAAYELEMTSPFSADRGVSTTNTMAFGIHAGVTTKENVSKNFEAARLVIQQR